MRGYAFIGAAIGWFALIGQYFASNTGKTGPALLDGSILYFSYFTILSNILVAISLTAVAYAPQSRIGRTLGAGSGAAAIAVYITVTGIVDWFLLRNLVHLSGLGILLDTIHHIVMPIVYVVFWLLFVPKGVLHLRYMLDWLLFPLVYGLYTLLHGQTSGFYPYPFVNVTKLGLDQVLRNMGRFVIFFALVSAAFVLVDRILGRLRQRATPEPPSLKPVPAATVTETAPVA